MMNGIYKFCISVSHFFFYVSVLQQGHGRESSCFCQHLDRNIVRTSNLMNGLSIRECEHRPLFSILSYRSMSLAVVCCGQRSYLCVIMQSIFEHLPRRSVCGSTLALHCRQDLYVWKEGTPPTVTSLITHSSSSLSPCSYVLNEDDFRAFLGHRVFLT